MRTRATYQVECLCGRQIESEERAAECPHCGLRIFLEWRGEKQDEPEPEPEAEAAQGASA